MPSGAVKKGSCVPKGEEEVEDGEVDERAISPARKLWNLNGMYADSWASRRNCEERISQRESTESAKTCV